MIGVRSRNADRRNDRIRRKILNPDPPADHQLLVTINVQLDLQTPTHFAWKPIAPPIVHIARNVKKS
jgi:hypothetical protein